MLTGIFDWVVLQTNVQKTVGMICWPLRAAGVRAYEAYTRRMTGEGRIFKDRQKERFICPECGKDLEKGSLVMHRQTQNGVDKGGLVSEGGRVGRADGCNGGNNPRTYRMAFPAWLGPRPFPVE